MNPPIQIRVKGEEVKRSNRLWRRNFCKTKGVPLFVFNMFTLLLSDVFVYRYHT